MWLVFHCYIAITTDFVLAKHVFLRNTCLSRQDIHIRMGLIELWIAHCIADQTHSLATLFVCGTLFEIEIFFLLRDENDIRDRKLTT